jgi:hypothetical protein
MSFSRVMVSVMAPTRAGAGGLKGRALAGAWAGAPGGGSVSSQFAGVRTRAGTGNGAWFTAPVPAPAQTQQPALSGLQV